MAGKASADKGRAAAEGALVGLETRPVQVRVAMAQVEVTLLEDHLSTKSPSQPLMLLQHQNLHRHHLFHYSS